MIFFLRKTKNISKSLVTIEITKNFELGQVLRRYNHKPSEIEYNYVEKWYNSKFKDLLIAKKEAELAQLKS